MRRAGSSRSRRAATNVPSLTSPKSVAFLVGVVAGIVAYHAYTLKKG